MADKIGITMSNGNDLKLADVMDICSRFDRALAEDGEASADPERQSTALTASAIYAGIIFARMMFFDLARQGDTARAAKLVGINFRNGIKIGLMHANRCAAEQGYGGNA
ncbi:hypothetical protein ACGGKE_03705 [Sphingobium naphthae]|uniref:hypothetical protein n=1 Tax=Sphingobium naphthae TaxID=1886786 RepID=UPI00374A5AA4